MEWEAVAVALVVLCGVLGCQMADGGWRPGVSDQPRGGETKEVEAPSTNARWDWTDRLGDLTVLGSYPSRGHGTGGWDAELRGNTGGAERIGNGFGRATVGSLLVQGHTQRGRGTHLGWFVMEKRGAGYFPAGGDWEYTVVRPGGDIEMRGKLDRCARCHAEAEENCVFTRSPQRTNDEQ